MPHAKYKMARFVIHRQEIICHIKKTSGMPNFQQKNRIKQMTTTKQGKLTTKQHKKKLETRRNRFATEKTNLIATACFCR